MERPAAHDGTPRTHDGAPAAPPPKLANIMGAIKLPTHKHMRKVTWHTRKVTRNHISQAVVRGKDGKHVISLTSSKSENFEKHVDKIVDSLNQGRMKTKAEAKRWLQKQLRGELRRSAEALIPGVGNTRDEKKIPTAHPSHHPSHPSHLGGYTCASN